MMFVIHIYLHPTLHNVALLLMLPLQLLLVPRAGGIGHQENHLDPLLLPHLCHPLPPAVPELPVLGSTGDHHHHPVTGSTGVWRQKEAHIPLQDHLLKLVPLCSVVVSH